MENLTGDSIKPNTWYWSVQDNNTGKILALAHSHQKAYGFITRAENKVNRPLPYIVTKIIYG